VIVHVATSFENAAGARAVMRALQAAGHNIERDWTALVTHNQHDAQRTRMLAITRAEVVVMILPAGRSSHVEMGMALGRGIPVVLLVEKAGDRTNPKDGRICSYYNHIGVKHAASLAEAVELVNWCKP
jgi:nucleoside 2-deoxyribosyltransferase